MFGLEDKALAILITFGFAANALIIRLVAGTLLHPSALFSLIWFLYTFLPLSLLINAPVNPLAIFFILACITSFSLSAIPFGWKHAYTKFKKNVSDTSVYSHNFNSSFMVLCLSLSSILSVFFSIWTMLINEWSPLDIFTDLLATTGRFAALRGNVGMEYGTIGTLGIFFTYLSSSIGGAIVYNQKRNARRLIFIILSILPGIFTMVIQSSKLVFFVSISFFVGSLLLAKLYHLDFVVIKGKYLKLFFIGALFTFPFVLISFISREHYRELEDFDSMISALLFAIASYSLAEVYAFSEFFSFYVGMPSQSSFLIDYDNFGAYTFNSIYQMVGINKEFPPGLYLETGFYVDVFETNIFTVFRGLIYDFGIVGTIIFFAVFGFVINYFFYRLLTIPKHRFAGVIFIEAFVFFTVSYLISVFMARYMYLNALGTWLIFRLNDKLTRNPYRASLETSSSRKWGITSTDWKERRC